MKIEYKVPISDMELDVIKYLAYKREQTNKGNNVPDTAKSWESHITLNVRGLIGEYGFCKFYNLHLDFNYHTRSGGYDCLFNNVRIDVKCTEHLNGNLLATTKENNDVDVYVLAIYHKQHLYFKGWLTKQEFITPKYLTKFNGSMSYVSEQLFLRPMAGLSAHCDPKGSRTFLYHAGL